MFIALRQGFSQTGAKLSAEGYLLGWLGHADARQVYDLPEGFLEVAVYDRRVEDLRKNKGCLSASRRLAAHQRGRAIEDENN